MMSWINTLRTSAEDLGTLAENEPPTGYEPNDFHISETTDIFIQEFSGDNRSLNLHDLEFDDCTICMALSSPLFTQEREDAAGRGQAYHSPDEGLSSSLSLSVSHDRTERPVVKPFDSQISSVRENPRHSSESEQIRILLERQKSRFSLTVKQRFEKHEFQGDYDRSIQKLIETIESQKEEIHRAHQGDERRRQDHNFFMNSY